MNVKNLVLGIGIVIVYGLLLWQGIEAFYPSPQYEDYCTSVQAYYPDMYAMKPTGELECAVNPSPQQYNECSEQGGYLAPESYDNLGCPVSYTCELCSKELSDATKSHGKTVFIIALIIGILTLIIGYAVLTVEPVGSALLASGIWAIFYGSAWNWSNLSSVWRFFLLLVALVLLIWFALRLNQVKRSFLGFGNSKKKR